AGGALLGAGIGAIAGDAGKGAAIGAGSGALFGGVRQKKKKQQQAQEQEQWAREQADQYAHKRSSYNRASAACLEGKGYTVK
ncbi:MAG: glycine zipper family protein, partial [Thermodesulfovibrionia bacterium]|nr:glycine zipper family protein [Thermodesulfovibrionia bacterium]